MPGHLSGSEALPRSPMNERGITLGGLFRCFLVIGITGFGGVLPVVIHELVRKRGWLDISEFTEILSVCQVLPGPNIVNISILFGARVAGFPGAMVSVAGLLLLPVALVLTLGVVYAQFAENQAV